MTIEEMKQAIKEHCYTHTPFCYSNGMCPLYNVVKTTCWDCDTDEEVIDHYNRCYPPEGGVANEPTPTEDIINHPTHYTNGGMECIDEMQLIFGRTATMNFCLLNAWKYRKRAMYKNGQEDMDKSDWYIAKYKELKDGDF
jgi:hypothetical protein